MSNGAHSVVEHTNPIGLTSSLQNAALTYQAPIAHRALKRRRPPAIALLPAPTAADFLPPPLNTLHATQVDVNQPSTKTHKSLLPSSRVSSASSNGSPSSVTSHESSVMRRSTSVSDEVWAKAIKAVKVQKMSLRQAAQLYGVHHMSLHRRVRGSCAIPTVDVRAVLTPEGEAEALGVLREQFLHEKRITSDDIRVVVRSIASNGGKHVIPVDFPPSRWISEFKRAHGFSKLNTYAYPPNIENNSPTDDVGGASDDNSSDHSSYSIQSSCQSYPRPIRNDQRILEYNRNDDYHGEPHHQYTLSHFKRDIGIPPPPFVGQMEKLDQDEFNGSSTSNGSHNSSDAGTTSIGSSISRSSDNGNFQRIDIRHKDDDKRSYRLSHTVPSEVWDKAIAAVELQGMSLRSAAKLYGVHFAALHRRVKKRAQCTELSPLQDYFHPDDEAGIIRVVVARAELGVLMTFDELVDLIQRAALRNLPDLSINAARDLMRRFQSRNEHSIRHIISDWPLQRVPSSNTDLNRLEVTAQMKPQYLASIAAPVPSGIPSEYPQASFSRILSTDKGGVSSHVPLPPVLPPPTTLLSRFPTSISSLTSHTSDCVTDERNTNSVMSGL